MIKYKNKIAGKLCFTCKYSKFNGDVVTCSEKNHNPEPIDRAEIMNFYLKNRTACSTFVRGKNTKNIQYLKTVIR